MASKPNSETTDCPICYEMSEVPKQLPCLHTFCLKCLLKFCKDENPGDTRHCPLCRNDFTIPVGGVNNIPNNELFMRLILEKNLKEGWKEKEFCELCKETGEELEAAAFCLDCRQYQCAKCRIRHAKLKFDKVHSIVDAKDKPSEAELSKLKSAYCSMHVEKKLELYCCDEKEIICLMCYATKHAKHVCKDLGEIAEISRTRINKDLKCVEMFSPIQRKYIESLSVLKDNFLRTITSVDSTIRQKFQKLHRILDDCEGELTLELNGMKETRLKEIAEHTDLREFGFAASDSFLAYSKMVLESGSDCEIIKCADDLHKRAEELKKSYSEETEQTLKSRFVKFVESGSTASVDSMKDFIGRLEYEDPLSHQINSEISDRKSTSGSNSGAALDGSLLICETPSGMKVSIRQGDLVEQKIDAIVNPANVRLMHGGGAAFAIQTAAGKALKYESQDHISKRGKLRIAEVIHTTSGKLYPTIKHVVHVAGPDSREVNDDEKCKELLQETFYNCLVYSNDKLEIQSIAIPAISSGIFGVPMDTVTMCAWEALCKFESYISNKMDKDRHLRDIKFINNDRKTVTAMRDTFSRELKKNPQFSVGDREPETNKGNRRARQLKRDSSNEPGDADSAARGALAIEPAKSPARKPSSSEEDIDTTESAEHGAKNKEEKEECAICQKVVKNPKELPCKHKFCTPCIDEWFKLQKRCPNCGAVFGVLRGDQPDGGRMEVNYSRASLPGFTREGTIEISYSIPGGIQKENHPNPGASYKGARRTAYLPDNGEGREVLKLLRKAFDCRLTFTIGTSTTSGAENVVTWNDIHHKTSRSTGSFGYPDDTYLKRVKDELAAKGIVP